MPARVMRGIVRGFGTIRRDVSCAETEEEFRRIEAELNDPDVLSEVGEESVRILREMVRERRGGKE